MYMIFIITNNNDTLRESCYCSCTTQELFTMVNNQNFQVFLFTMVVKTYNMS